jgi:hypothetical protein
MASKSNTLEKKICDIENRNNDQDIDIAVIKEHCKNFNKFMTNDFPHFQDDVKNSLENLSNKFDSMKTQISLGLVIGIVSVIILQVILGFFNK